MNHDDLTQALDDLRDAGVTFEPVPSAAALVRTLRERGLHVEPADAGVRIWPQRLLGAEDRAHLEARLDDLVALLHAERRPTVAPALRARAADLIALARTKLGDEFAQRMLALFAADPQRAVHEIENALAMHAARGRVSDAATAIYQRLLHEAGRAASSNAILIRHGDPHAARYPGSKEAAADAERVVLLVEELIDAGLVSRQGSGVSARLPEGVAP